MIFSFDFECLYLVQAKEQGKAEVEELLSKLEKVQITHDDWNSFEICLCPSEWIIEQAGGEHSLNNSSVIRSLSDLTQTALSVLFSGMDRTSLWALLALTECSDWSRDTGRQSRHNTIVLVLNYYY